MDKVYTYPKFEEYITLYRGPIKVWIADGTEENPGAAGKLYVKFTGGDVQEVGYVSDYNDAKRALAEAGIENELTYPKWIEMLTAVPSNALKAEAFANGTKNGEQVTSEDETYEHNAKYFSEKAEAWVKGTKNGIDVPSDDEAYNNNAKYFSEVSALWATGGTEGTPTEINNAKHYAEVAEERADHLDMDLSELRDDLANAIARIVDLEYKPITINTISINPSQAEIGSTVSSLSINYTLNKIPVSARLDNETKTVTETSGVFTINSSLQANKSWVFSVTDEKNHTDTKTVSLSFLNKAYYGKAAAPSNINSSFLLGLENGVLTSTKARAVTVNAGANEYIWYAVPSSFGTCSFKVGGFDGGFTKISTFSHTNSTGQYSTNYDVYRSDNAALGNTTVVIS